MFQGKKTYVVAVLTLLVGVLAETDWVRFVDDPKGGLGLIAGALVMGVMRWITQQTTVRAAELAEPPKPAPSEGA